MTIGEQLERIWQGLLDLTSNFVLPDWGGLIGLLPWAVLLFLVGPIVSLLVLAWFVYVVRAPRTRAAYVEPGPVKAAVGEDGLPDVPSGEPFCFRDGLIYPPRERRCDICRQELSVKCPKCEVVRPAHVTTCANCGLELRLHERPRSLAPAGPPPGGAAAA